MKNTQKHEKPTEWDTDYELALVHLAHELGYRVRTVKTLIRLGILDKSRLDLKPDLS